MTRYSQSSTRDGHGEQPLSSGYRMSDIGVRGKNENDDSIENIGQLKVRRQTISEGFGKVNLLDDEVSNANSSVGKSPKRKSKDSSTIKSGVTPSKQTLNLGVASSYYFSDAPKTPTQKLVRKFQQRKQLASALKSTEKTSDDHLGKENYENEEYTGTITEESILSLGDSNTSSSYDETDLLNKSVLSDTTELTASNFVLAKKSRQSLSENILASFAPTSKKNPNRSRRSLSENVLASFAPTSKKNPNIEDIQVHADNYEKQSVETVVQVSKSPFLSSIDDRISRKDKPQESGDDIIPVDRRATLPPGVLAPRNGNMTRPETPGSRRQTINGPPRFGSMSPANLGSLLSSMKRQRQQRERLILQERKRRFSSGSDASAQKKTGTSILDSNGSKDPPDWSNIDVSSSQRRLSFARSLHRRQNIESNDNDQLAAARQQHTTNTAARLHLRSDESEPVNDETAEVTTQFDLFKDLMLSQEYKGRETATGDVNNYLEISAPTRETAELLHSSTSETFGYARNSFGANHYTSFNDGADDELLNATGKKSGRFLSPSRSVTVKSKSKSPSTTFHSVSDSPARNTRSARKDATKLISIDGAIGPNNQQSDDKETEACTKNGYDTTSMSLGSMLNNMHRSYSAGHGNSPNTSRLHLLEKEDSGSSPSCIQGSKQGSSKSVDLKMRTDIDSPARNTRSAKKRSDADSPTANIQHTRSEDIDVGSAIGADTSSMPLGNLFDDFHKNISLFSSAVAEGSQCISIEKKDTSPENTEKSISGGKSPSQQVNKWVDSPARNTRSSTKLSERVNANSDIADTNTLADNRAELDGSDPDFMDTTSMSLGDLFGYVQENDVTNFNETACKVSEKEDQKNFDSYLALSTYNTRFESSELGHEAITTNRSYPKSNVQGTLKEALDIKESTTDSFSGETESSPSVTHNELEKINEHADNTTAAFQDLFVDASDSKEKSAEKGDLVGATLSPPFLNRSLHGSSPPIGDDDESKSVKYKDRRHSGLFDSPARNTRSARRRKEFDEYDFIDVGKLSSPIVAATSVSEKHSKMGSSSVFIPGTVCEGNLTVSPLLHRIRGRDSSSLRKQSIWRTLESDVVDSGPDTERHIASDNKNMSPEQLSSVIKSQSSQSSILDSPARNTRGARKRQHDQSSSVCDGNDVDGMKEIPLTKSMRSIERMKVPQSSSCLSSLLSADDSDGSLLVSPLVIRRRSHVSSISETSRGSRMDAGKTSGFFASSSADLNVAHASTVDESFDKPHVESIESTTVNMSGDSTGSVGDLFDDIVVTKSSDQSGSNHSGDIMAADDYTNSSESSASEGVARTENHKQPILNHQFDSDANQSSADCTVRSPVHLPLKNATIRTAGSGERRALFLETLQMDLATIGKNRNSMLSISNSGEKLGHAVINQAQSTRSQIGQISRLECANETSQTMQCDEKFGFSSTLSESPIANKRDISADSPARNTRSALKRAKLHDQIQEDIAQVNGDFCYDTIDFSRVVDGHDFLVASSKSLLNSALRKPGSSRKIKSGRKVAFGSPEMAEYNIGSPSTSFTPMPSTRKTNKVPKMIENTEEIDADMNALLKGVTNAHSPTPNLFNHADDTSHIPEIINHSDMSIDSAVFTSIDDEQTNGLEMSMTDLLESARGIRSFESRSPSVNESHNREYPGEDATMELEPDIETLLLINKKAPSPSSVSTGDGTPRQHNIESRRISLKSGCRLSLSTDGGKDDPADSLTHQSENLNFSRSQMQAEENLTENLLDLTAGEVFDLVPLGQRSEADLLCSLAVSSVSSNISDQMTPLFEEVLHMILENTDGDIDDNSPLKASDDMLSVYLSVQHAIRSSSRAEIESELCSLWSVLFEQENYSWTQWLVSVIKTVLCQLDARIETISKEWNDLDANALAIEEGVGLMASFSKRKVLAKVMEQDAICIVSLEEEIRQMEDEVDKSRHHGAQKLEELTVIEGLLTAWGVHEDMFNQTSSEQQLGGSAHRNVMSLNCFCKWKPIGINSRTMSFTMMGPCPKACLHVECLSLPSGGVKLEACIKPTLFKKTNGLLQRQLKSVLHFVENRVAAIYSSVHMRQLDHPSDIGNFLRRIEWQFGRLEDTAAEMAMIHRRYKAVLSASKTSDFNLVVSFGTPPKLRATFVISDDFLFSPISVSLESVDSRIDTGALQNLLVKKEKPGFGCLARTCGIISAFLKQT